MPSDDTPSLIRLADMYHLATTITGTLTVDASALTLAGSLHPTAAVCGTPASSAMDLIRELEDMDRARYAGPVGWMDARGDGPPGCSLGAASWPRPARLPNWLKLRRKFRPMLRALRERA